MQRTSRRDEAAARAANQRDAAGRNASRAARRRDAAGCTATCRPAAAARFPVRYRGGGAGSAFPSGWLHPGSAFASGWLHPGSAFASGWLHPGSARDGRTGRCGIAGYRGKRAPAPHKFLSAETLNSRSPGSRELFKLPTISSSKSFGEPANPYATRVLGNTAAPGKLPATRLENRTAHRDYLPHTSSAISRTRATLAHCCSSVSLLPTSQLAKPHCGDR